MRVGANSVELYLHCFFVVTGAVDFNAVHGCGRTMYPDMAHGNSLSWMSLWSEFGLQKSWFCMVPVGGHPLDINLVTSSGPDSW